MIEQERKIFDVDSSSRRRTSFIDNDREKFEVRFENSDLNAVADTLNLLTEVFTVVSSSQNNAVLADEKDSSFDSSYTSEKTVTGLFSGTFQEIIRDVCVKGGFVYDRIDNHFYISDSPVNLSFVRVSTVVETSMTQEEAEKLAASFGDGVAFTLVSSKILITGRFYDVKNFREYVETLNETKRSYVARLVFVRLDRSKISRIEAEIKASPLDLISENYNLYDVFQTQLDVKLTNDRSYNYNEQLIYCTDGQKSQLKIGSSMQREKRSVSDYGTSSVSGYQEFQDGVDVELTPYRSLNGIVDLQLKFENSKFVDSSNLSKNQVNLEYLNYR